MSQFDEALERYKSEMEGKLGMTDINADLLKEITKSLGPSIYLEDASRVSCSDKEELDRVKNNFLIKKLGMEEGPKLDEAIKEVCEEMGSSNRNKFRAIFYYILVKKFGVESQFV